MGQTYSHLGGHHSLPMLGGAFAALFQGRNPALHAALQTHRHAEEMQNAGSAQPEHNKGFQPLLPICLKQVSECHVHV